MKKKKLKNTITGKILIGLLFTGVVLNILIASFIGIALYRVSSNSFEETIRLIVSLGGDSDTQGAMACPIAAVTPRMEMPEEIFKDTKRLLDDYLWNIFEDFEKFLNKRQ